MVDSLSAARADPAILENEQLQAIQDGRTPFTRQLAGQQPLGNVALHQAQAPQAEPRSAARAKHLSVSVVEHVASLFVRVEGAAAFARASPGGAGLLADATILAIRADPQAAGPADRVGCRRAAVPAWW